MSSSPRASAGRDRPREVRVIGGRWKRSRLPVPDSPGLRPTPDRVRETLFNWLGQDLTGWRCLDAFAGTGALGLEAASRGAGQVVLVERDPRLVDGLRQSVRRLGASTVRVEQADAMAWMSDQPSDAFELVLLDPPFAASLFEAAVHAAATLVAPGGWLYLESDRAWRDEEWRAAGFEPRRHLRAGAVHAHLVRRPVRPPGPQQVGDEQAPEYAGLHCAAPSSTSELGTPGAAAVAHPIEDEPTRRTT